ncbi:MAG: hypothetical protein ACR2MX_06525 [Cyclobacteriaceae bacterium]
MRGPFINTFIVILSCWLLQACQAEEAPVTQQQLDQLTSEIEALVEDKSCQGAGDCASIAVGAKPCGGPDYYLVFAKSKVDQQLLEEKGNAYNQLKERFNVENRLVSDCAVVTAPEVSCQDQVCAPLD